ncbi:MAG TPA: helix-turn-helix transcriptional regulator [Gaiellaceae bacterium]|nr:helix-turn-helix transcriptional regulator [Gaiellaceae bacterium]
MHGHGQHRRGRSRSRRRVEDGTWEVRARVEGFAEPALLSLIADGTTHGYELLDRLPSLLRGDRVDVGNVYRLLRRLEDDGLVVSEWRGDLPGPAKRNYELTPAGRTALDAWRASLQSLQSDITDFLRHTQKGGEHARTSRKTRLSDAMGSQDAES